MTDAADVNETILTILGHYPLLTPLDAAAFLQVCAEDGLSLKTLSKRVGYGQSIVARHVTALIEMGLVESRSPSVDSLRRTVRLTSEGLMLKSLLQTGR